jgi:hypothetical protein
VGPRKNISLDFLEFVMRPPSNGECDKNNSVQLTSSDPTAVIPVSTICGNNSMVSISEARSVQNNGIQYCGSGSVCFGPPGSGSIGTRYESGSFYHHAKIVRKTLIPTVVCLLYELLSLKNDVNVASKSNSKKLIFCCHLEGH